VQQIFEQVFSLSTELPADSQTLLAWGSEADRQLIINDLEQLGFHAPDKTRQLIEDFKNSGAIRRLHHKGTESLDRLMPQLIKQVSKVNNPDLTLARILALLEKVAGRSVYLTLLAENPEALSQLIKLSSASHWICQYLALHPVIYDELLDARTLYEPLNEEDLSAQLTLQLQAVDEQDVEQMMIVLREFKQVNVLKVAAADIMEVIPIMVVSDYLTYIAEALLDQAVRWVWRLLVEKHGTPPDAGEQVKGFGIIGMGKLGGLELGYGSDLDMVFIHDCADGNAMTDGPKPISCSQFYGRLGQRVMTLINTRVLSGVLYEVDMRLRPNGNSGLLVSYIEAYRDYLKNQAWTWEHQALVRGRFIAGDPVNKQKFEQVRKQIICLPRDREVLKAEVREMREKMRDNLAVTEAERFDLKQSIGGIADIEFIVQFMVLANAEQNQQLVKFTDNIRILDTLQNCGLITDQDAQILKQAYCAYRDRGHRQVLLGDRVVIEAQAFTEMRSQVTAIWKKMME
ncbi:MAG: bifunctional [glutamate--ammonia ligase]-adenylyl-L-tyrosine phosphorylase/[glutamate--ammonia-ligase] adenylyltransferase, partial [Methyloprofundus sp.]|nr:bifunctional [glutamate--ammonia ligase]-adenylyl-L-tyrosine phosphorylase/[glutamate--ammonia-ligase] adenylyltransferase [Methyloprofundus sp.]